MKLYYLLLSIAVSFSASSLANAEDSSQPSILQSLPTDQIKLISLPERGEIRAEYSSSISRVWYFCMTQGIDCGTIRYYKTRHGRDRWKVDFWRNGRKGTYSY